MSVRYCSSSTQDLEKCDTNIATNVSVNKILIFFETQCIMLLGTDMEAQKTQYSLKKQQQQSCKLCQY